MSLNRKVETFMKLNIFSALYAFVLFIQTQLMINIYPIARITNWLINTVTIAVGVLMLTLLIFTSILFFIITKKYLSKVKTRFLVAILWLPYFVFFTLSLSPTIVRGEEPPSVVGLFLIGIFFMYPFYIVFINAISSSADR